MKRIVIFVLLLALAVGLGVVSYNYLTIRDGGRVYFMEKRTGTFDRVYLDVTDWSPADYLRHPKVSAFLAAKGIRKTGKRWKQALEAGMEKAGDAVEKGVDTVKEKLDGDE